MTTAHKLSEEGIQKALSQGYITQIEARQMLKAYFNKSDFSPTAHRSVPSTQPRQQST